MDEEQLIQFFGIISVRSISNSKNTELLMEERNVRFVHYPDCQQLIIYLPEYYRNYDSFVILSTDDRTTIFDKKVSEIINGSIQILIDSLFIAPGNYEIIITRNDGNNHIISFQKHEVGYVEEIIVPDPPPVVESKPEDKFSQYKIYKDGFGKEIPNEDLEIRQKVIDKIASRLGRNLSYTGNLRAGSVIFTEGNTRLEFWTEMGGGNCLFYISIPTSGGWESATGLPLADRNDIIEFIAERALHDQAGSCRYTITEDFITYYHK